LGSVGSCQHAVEIEQSTHAAKFAMVTTISSKTGPYQSTAAHVTFTAFPWNRSINGTQSRISKRKPRIVRFIGPIWQVLKSPNYFLDVRCPTFLNLPVGRCQLPLRTPFYSEYVRRNTATSRVIAGGRALLTAVNQMRPAWPVYSRRTSVQSDELTIRPPSC
jgi:hypothetical protein